MVERRGCVPGGSSSSRGSNRNRGRGLMRWEPGPRGGRHHHCRVRRLLLLLLPGRRMSSVRVRGHGPRRKVLVHCGRVVHGGPGLRGSCWCCCPGDLRAAPLSHGVCNRSRGAGAAHLEPPLGRVLEPAGMAMQEGTSPHDCREGGGGED